MSDLRFEWDVSKASVNRKRHGVSFEEAQSAFLDDNALLIDDPDHSVLELRFLLLGVSSRLRTLVVCHCTRQRGNVIRIISARKASRSERTLYSKGLSR